MPETKTPENTSPETKTTTDAEQTEAAASTATAEIDPVLASRVEAIVLSNSKPVAASRIADVINALSEGTIEAADVELAVESLNATYEETGRAFRIETVAGGYRVMTQPEHADVLAAFHRKQASSRLSRPAVETLAIIAYKQPITRAKLEAIRGVGCGEVLRSLLERKLIAVTGRAEELGRPMLYGTTKHFLDSFGIKSVKDLPSVETMVKANEDAATA